MQRVLAACLLAAAGCAQGEEASPADGGRGDGGPVQSDGAAGKPTGDATADTGPLARCGNGRVERGEQCDDGNRFDEDGCSARCAVEPGWRCEGDPSKCGNCGNGVVEPLEECDDGFTDACGSCNADCTGAGEGATCGDGEVCPELEACDDGFTDACGSCNADCTGPGEESTCGDGELCPETEACDDGNMRGGDTCTADCSAECANVATDPGVIASSSGGGSADGRGPAEMNDGDYEESCDFHWISASSVPDGEWIELQLGSEVEVHAIAVDTTPANVSTCGNNTGRSLAGGRVQWWDGADWVTDGTVADQTDDWSYVFTEPATTTRLRLMDAHATDVTGQQSNPIIYEWEAFRCE